MNRSILQSALLLFAVALSVKAADLSKVDRTIGREPAYQSKPKYCLVVFGPEAKTRIWVVLAGNTVYGSDKNGEISKVTLQSEGGYYLPIPGTPQVLVVQAPDKAKGVGAMRMEYRLETNAAVKQTIEGTVRLGDDPKTAPVIHFDGSYTSTLRERGVIENGKFVRNLSEVESIFHVFIGSNVLQKEGASSPTIPDGALGGATFVRKWWYQISEERRPVAEFEFPHQDPSQAPIKMRVPLVFR
jgi:hypothetical protein